MSSAVLDASAVLALVKAEPGWEEIADAVTAGAAISAVNLSEVVAKLAESGQTEAAIRAALGRLGLEVSDFDEEQAYRAGQLRPLTRAAGLSLGDRACLALAARLDLPALTTDRTWQGLPVGVSVRVIR